jgi:phosphoenolpyruvate carboxylase
MAPNHSVPGDKFQEFVGIKFQLYNSLFLSLPFYGVDKTGILLSLFNEQCEVGFAGGKSPSEIVDGFLSQYSNKTVDLLFRFVQYVERQVVLFDALEDSAFPHVHEMNGPGTLGHLLGAVEQNNRSEALIARLEEFSIRIVLTAHPTQFYPGAVLGIINDLVEAIEANEVSNINTLLQQLGRTPFFKKQRPTPYDEAVSQIWYLENIFYEAAGAIAAELRAFGGIDAIDLRHLIKIGFWSGGDRDGNPFVTSETTLRVAASLRRAILRCYYNDVRKLKRRLTFTGVENAIAELEHLLYNEAYRSAESSLTTAEIKSRLDGIREVLVTKHNSLFVHLLDDLRNKVEIFGTHFVALDIRQEASVHGDVLSEIIPGYSEMGEDQRIAKLIDAAPLNSRRLDGILDETLKTIDAIRTIQGQNGPDGCERYIISQCRNALNVMEVYGLFLLGGRKTENIAVDIVPLFETIADLENAAVTMRELYELPAYREHLSRRGDRQTIMLGFSDGTKDGGYLMANWSIYKAKDELTTLAREYGITVIFFDGRGGPPARGGGKTHKFYSSMGENIAGEAIEITVQGQTISSNFGTPQSARFNIEQLLNSGVYNRIFAPKDATFRPDEESLLARLASESFAAYDELKNHPGFLKYLSDVTPLRFYAQANIGSRPAKRGSGELTLQDLRAIPFVGAWSQLKQNVPGFYGVGTALKKLETEIDAAKAMYRENLFFKALIDNCEMAMQKSFFGLTAFLADDPQYGPIWRKIHDEFELTRHYLGIVTGSKNLMSDLPVEQQSVSTRERVVLPLITIQQYALTKLRTLADAPENIETRSILEKLVIRCSFGIINAGRNSA